MLHRIFCELAFTALIPNDGWYTVPWNHRPECTTLNKHEMCSYLLKIRGKLPKCINLQYKDKLQER